MINLSKGKLVRLMAFAIISIAASTIFGCAKVTSRPLPPAAIRPSIDYKAIGTASWYGPGFHGRKTASGERFNQKDMTAAHRSLPFGTVLKVTNIANGKSVDVKVNDRGPFIGGRIIDLSKAAASEIGLLGTGTGRVDLVAIAGPNDVLIPKINTSPARKRIGTTAFWSNKRYHSRGKPFKAISGESSPETPTANAVNF